MAAPAGALIGPTPAPSNATTLTFTTPITGLAPGQTVTYHADTAAASLTKVDAKWCATGFSSYGATTFGYDGASGVRCVYAPGITGGGLTGIQSNYRNLATFSGTQHSGNLNFAAGTGTVTWNNNTGDGPNTLLCDKTHPCDLVYEVGLQGDAVPSTFFIQPLTFAGTPNAPVISSVTPANTQATVNWSSLAAGLPSGNGTIDKYTVTATPQTPSVGTCPATGTSVNVTTGFSLPSTPVSATSATFAPGTLANFCTYDFSLTAENVASDGATHFSSASSAAVSGQPTQAGPALSGAPGDSQVTLNWGAIGGATNYRITVSPLPSSGPCASGTCLAGNVTTFNVGGLGNGTPYAFTVAAQIGANFTGESNTLSLTPNGALIRQTIDVVRPQGTLVISQYCSGSPTDIQGNFDPSNNNGNDVPNAVPNTNCNLTLSGPRTDQLKTDAITAQPRSVTDAVTDGTTTVQSDTIAFTANDLNQFVRGDGIPAGTRIVSVTDASHAVLSSAATISFDGGQLAIVGNTINFGTVSGPFAITYDVSTAHTAGREIEGLQIPGGSTITTVSSNGTIDISQPADAASNGFATREWLQAPTPAHLITSGPQAGQYLKATGQLRQVMIVDTRPADTGWTATGVMGTFNDGSGHTFSGDNLGWSPKTVHAYSQPFTSPDGAYSMAPAKGGLVLPATIGGLGTGTTASNDTLVASPVPGKTLAFANGGHGLGLAQLDADLTLYIPVFKVAGHYTGVLTLTAV